MAHRMESGCYPAGTEFDPNAPWNEKEPTEVGVDAVVTLTISKRVKIYTTDYETDEDGSIYDYGDLKADAREQIDIPKGWNYIDMEVEY